MTALIDTDVLIEAQRGQGAAREWLMTPGLQLALPAVVALELLAGSRDKGELARAERFLSSFDVVPFHPRETDIAQRLIATHRLSTGLSLPDFLIAAQAIHLSTTLYTFNLKHFGAIPDLDAKAPYAR